ncbi:MAG: hypothetical protein GY850_44185 [bacterium]|nr:hypothetical protein [bacterium]
MEIQAIREKLVDLNSEKIKTDGMVSEKESLKSQLFGALAEAQKATDKKHSLSQILFVSLRPT